MSKVPLVVRTAPERIYLQVAEDEGYRDQPFPDHSGDEVTWCQDSVLEVEVEYVRADLFDAAIRQAREGAIEEAAQEAWSTGMKAHDNARGLPLDARAVGSQCAAAIRGLAKGAE